MIVNSVVKFIFCNRFYQSQNRSQKHCFLVVTDYLYEIQGTRQSEVDYLFEAHDIRWSRANHLLFKAQDARWSEIDHLFEIQNARWPEADHLFKTCDA